MKDPFWRTTLASVVIRLYLSTAAATRSAYLVSSMTSAPALVPNTSMNCAGHTAAWYHQPAVFAAGPVWYLLRVQSSPQNTSRQNTGTSVTRHRRFERRCGRRFGCVFCDGREFWDAALRLEGFLAPQLFAISSTKIELPFLDRLRLTHARRVLEM